MLDAAQKEIDAFYGRYADKEQITLAEAKRRVSKLDIAAYQRKAKRYVADKDFSKQANEEMRLYNLTMKVNRLEMLKANIGLELSGAVLKPMRAVEDVASGFWERYFDLVAVREENERLKARLADLESRLLANGEDLAELKRLRAAGYAVKSVFDIIANDNETETVVYTSPDFQPCADTFSEKYHFVGPLLRPAQSSFEKLPGRSLIYISLGTVNNDALPFYRACLAAFGGDPRFQLVLSAGTQTDLAALGPIPENCTVRASVDQMAVLDCADVFLTHCGMNSASEGLWHGLPLVLYPQTPEQHGVANRVAALGAGVPLTDPSADGIRRAVEAALADPSYRENAQKLADGFRRCGGAVEAADAIEHAAN